MSDIHLEGRSCYLVPHRKDQVLSKFGKKKKIRLVLQLKKEKKCGFSS